MHILPPRSWEVIRFEIIHISQMSVVCYVVTTRRATLGTSIKPSDIRAHCTPSL